MTDEKKPDDVPVVVPPLGETIVEAELHTWLVRSGDPVAQDQPIAHLQLDKVDVELVAPADGMLLVAPRESSAAKVGEIVATIVPAVPQDPAREARHAELNAAVAAAPHDAGVRQVYADFLLSSPGRLGRWGAETVALRAEYLSLVGATRTEAIARRAELESVARSTAIDLYAVGWEVRVTDGFVTGVHVDATSFLADHARIFAAAPVVELGLRGLADAALIERVLALPRLDQLRRLVLRGGTAVARFVEAPALAQLARLELDGIALDDPARRAIGAHPALRELAFDHVFRDSTELFAIVAALPPALGELDLRRARLWDVKTPIPTDVLAALRAHVSATVAIRT